MLFLDYFSKCHDLWHINMTQQSLAFIYNFTLTDRKLTSKLVYTTIDLAKKK